MAFSKKSQYQISLKYIQLFFYGSGIHKKKAKAIPVTGCGGP
jgi:hypothetical protein